MHFVMSTKVMVSGAINIQNIVKKQISFPAYINKRLTFATR